MRYPATIATVALLCLGAASGALPQDTPAPPTVAAYDIFETEVPVVDVPDNPYDPAQIAVDAAFTTPSGRCLVVPAFFRVQHEVVVTPLAERLRDMRLLKFYLSANAWVGGDSISYVLDDVRLVRKDGTEVVIGDFEVDDPRWQGAGVPVVVEREIVRSGVDALRADFPVEKHSSHPGLTMDLRGQDWGDVKQLRFAFYPLTNHKRGTLSVEFYAGQDDKVQASFAVGGEGLELNDWNDVVWDLESVGDRKEARPTGPGKFFVRYCPGEVGIHRYVVRRQGFDAPLLEGSLEVAPSNRPGFLRVAGPDARLVSFDSGKPQVLVGENMCWYSRGGLNDYDHWLGKLASVGGNYIRVWMAPWCFGIEWQELGRYQQDRAEELDYVFRRARGLGINIMLCLDYHGFLIAKQSWGASPYNARRGGPCEHPIDFMTNEQAKTQYKKRLRYLVARYGTYDNLLAWEFWNEVTYIDGYESDVVAAWHQEMARYLRSIDPYAHIITTSFGGGLGDEKVWSLPEIEYTQSHTYSGMDKVEEVIQAAEYFLEAYKKPFLVGEFGVGGSGGESETRDPDGLHLHNGAWAGVMAGTMGTAMTWWWDGYVENGNMHRHWAPVARFATDLPTVVRPLGAGEVRVAYAEKNPPLAYDDVIIEGRGASWQEAEFNKPQSFAVDKDGHVEGMERLARVLHGVRNHPTLHNPATFELDCDRPCRFVVEVSGVSGHGGAGLRISVDGQAVLERTFPDEDDSTATLTEYNGPYSVDVPAGRHTVTVENTGNDWVYVAYTVEGYRPLVEPNYRVLGVTGSGRAWLWLHNRQSTWSRQLRRKQDPIPIPPSLLTLEGLPDGFYRVEWWDTWRGEPFGTVGARSSRGWMRLQVPGFARDLACKIRPD